METTRNGYVWAAFAACIASYASGTIMAFTSPVEQELKADFKDIDISLFGSLATLGAFGGGLVCGYLMENLGRKGAVLFTSPIVLIGWILIIWRENCLMLYAARVILGFTAAIIGAAVPPYNGEISIPERRGIIGTGHQLAIVLSVLSTFCFGAFMKLTALAVVSGVPMLVATIALLFVPESPEWMIQKKKDKMRILDALQSLYGKDSEHGRALEERIDSSDSQQQEVTQSSFKDLCHWSVMKPFLISLLLIITQQGSGISAVIFYASTIFKAAGTSLDPSLEAIIIAVVQVVFTIIAALLIDRFGRRLLMSVSSLTIIISFSTLIVSLLVKSESFKWVPVMALSVYIAGFSLGVGPVPWLLVSELLPTRCRSIGLGILTAFNWLTAFTVTKSFPGILENLGGHVAFSIFAVISTICAIVVYVVLPETKGKSLEEIELLFNTDEEETIEDTGRTNETSFN